MARRRNEIPGEMAQYEKPNWEPLRDLLDDQLVGWFMWMHEVELEDGTRLHAYKHRSTRRYFHLACDGRAFTYSRRGNYTQISPASAMHDAFWMWKPDRADAELLHEAERWARSEI